MRSAVVLVAAVMAGCAPAPPAAESNGPQVVTFARGALSGVRQRIDFLTSLNPDCSFNGPGTFTFLSRLVHGTVQLEQGSGFPGFPSTNPRSKCNDRPVAGTLVYVTSDRGFTGSDRFSFEWITPSGYIYRRQYDITVR